ncbi:unnamed protein product [Clavelina lepadiformis]|uniref:H15 domain-containing protein n=1 Tax=Clavelina lepadiformis TaxID=159417 RepID=A0ABP0FE83_CLALP
MNTTYTMENSTSSSSSSNGDVDYESELESPTKKLVFDAEDNDSDMQTDDGAKSRNKSSKRPPFSDMIVEAIRVDNSKKGTTIPFIKTYLKDTYMVTDIIIKRQLKPAIEKGLKEEMILRSKSSKGTKVSTGMTGRFKVNMQWLKEKQKFVKKRAPKQSASENATRKTAPENAATKAAAIKKRVAKEVKVGGKPLRSLQEKTLSVKLAKNKVKQARMSLGVSSGLAAVGNHSRDAKKSTAPATKKTSTKKPSKAVKSTKSTDNKKSPKPKGRKTAKSASTMVKSPTSPKEPQKSKRVIKDTNKKESQKTATKKAPAKAKKTK